MFSKSSGRFFQWYDTRSIFTLTVGGKKDWGQIVSPNILLDRKTRIKKNRINKIEKIILNLIFIHLNYI